MKSKESLYKNFPDTPGVYLMKDKRGSILYVGKAGSLKRRVSSYFLRSGDWKTEKLVSEIAKIDYKKTDTAIEALILEAKLIKKHRPPYNVRKKDDKSFLYVEITRDKFPRVLLVRGKELALGRRGGPALSRVEGFGPFTSATSIRDALRIIRKIFPYSVHPSASLGTSPSTKLRTSEPGKSKGLYPEDFRLSSVEGPRRRACFDYEIGLCPGTCVGLIDRKSYLRNIRNIKLLFQGRKGKILENLTKEMKRASGKLEFERAELLKRQIFGLQHIQDIALITEPETTEGPALGRRGGPALSRVEGYDISNISGTHAVGSMVVFSGNKPNKSEYRKFKIRTVKEINDVGMLYEIIKRRFANSWPLPDLILIDGGSGQVNVAKRVLSEFGLKLPVVGIAKGPKRKANRFVGSPPAWALKKTLIQVRDEAHRFALSYHKKLRQRNFIQ